MTSSGAAHRYRLLAFVIDLLILALVAGVATGVARATESVVGTDLINVWVWLLLIALLGVVYHAGMVWLTGGQTIGKAMCSLTVRRIDGRAPRRDGAGLAWATWRPTTLGWTRSATSSATCRSRSTWPAVTCGRTAATSALTTTWPISIVRTSSSTPRCSAPGSTTPFPPTHHVPGVAQTFALGLGRLDGGREIDRVAIALLARIAWMALGEPVPANLGRGASRLARLPRRVAGRNDSGCPLR
jgi:uncharacterized RDD family membrane protein YckC